MFILSGWQDHILTLNGNAIHCNHCQYSLLASTYLTCRLWYCTFMESFHFSGHNWFHCCVMRQLLFASQQRVLQICVLLHLSTVFFAVSIINIGQYLCYFLTKTIEHHSDRRSDVCTKDVVFFFPILPIVHSPAFVLHLFSEVRRGIHVASLLSWL